MNWAKVGDSLFRHHLPLMFAIVILISLTAPAPGQAIAKPVIGDYKVVQTVNTCIIFILSGISLNSSEIKRALQAWEGCIYAFIVILFITPLIGFIVINIPFSPEEFALGFAVFCCTPTSVSTGTQLVQIAEGNVALSLMQTVTTNVIGSLTVPIMLSAVIGGGSDVHFSPTKMIVQLCFTCLVPSLVGKCMREFIPGVAQFVTKYKMYFSLFSSLNLCMVLWQTMSNSRESIINTGIGKIFILIGAGISVSLTLLLMSIFFTCFLSRIVKPINGWPILNRFQAFITCKKTENDDLESDMPRRRKSSFTRIDNYVITPKLLDLNKESEPKSFSQKCFEFLWPVAAGRGAFFDAHGPGKFPLMSPAELKAIILMPAQKALPMAVTIASFLEFEGGEAPRGLVIVSCVVSHCSQLFIISFFSNWLRKMENWPTLTKTTPINCEVEEGENQIPPSIAAIANARAASLALEQVPVSAVSLNSSENDHTLPTSPPILSSNKITNENILSSNFTESNAGELPMKVTTNIIEMQRSKMGSALMRASLEGIVELTEDSKAENRSKSTNNNSSDEMGKNENVSQGSSSPNYDMFDFSNIINSERRSNYSPSKNSPLLRPSTSPSSPGICRTLSASLSIPPHLVLAPTSSLVSQSISSNSSSCSSSCSSTKGGGCGNDARPSTGRRETAFMSPLEECSSEEGSIFDASPSATPISNLHIEIIINNEVSKC